MEHAIEKVFGQNEIETFDFSYKIFKNCSFIKSTIKSKDFSNSVFLNCHFTSCEFIDCNFQSTVFKNLGSWYDCTFKSNNFLKTVIGNIKIEKLMFSTNNFNKTLFDGTEMSAVVFDGKIDSSWFYGVSSAESLYARDFFIIKKLKPLKKPSINFEGAELNDVVFSRGLDLSNIKFPDKSHLKTVINPLQFFDSFLNKCRRIFSDKESKDFCREFIDRSLFNTDSQGMPMLLIDLKTFDESRDTRVQRIVELLKAS
ncbi:pentapeptide repeat-containing protein [Sphingobacterium detergens]|uniref:Pentapeptide repeat protein n=1 Tax=Sphingobacterium detergens TaxID=1145106 RepID=A0A420BK03_SPHD1|nr:pentapeptide repeat-containing protein [Sphingobacterium detergens]RKE57101.1 pentapeptide repeat protein [Sphingobacterium detergens]